MLSWKERIAEKARAVKTVTDGRGSKEAGGSRA